MAAVRKITVGEKVQYISALNSMGEEEMCLSIVKTWLGRAQGKDPIELPDVVLLDTSDSLFALYREKGNPELFVLGRIFRRAAHIVYRQMCNIKPKRKINHSRFIREVIIKT